ncbi:MAG: nucleotide excision repair endonuclease [Verrucomicrobiia bacterium]
MFPDARPLVALLGREFFLHAPQCPGVYLMRDPGGAVLYVGKARNLRKRLNSYRVANPDRMLRRQLRLLRSVASIELEPCADEPAALARESELLRSLKPKFNRAGTWQGPPRFLLWRGKGMEIELSVGKEPVPGWRTFGPLGTGAFHLRGVLARLLWLALHPGSGAASLPIGWAEGRTGEPAVLWAGPAASEITAQLALLFSGQADAFCRWIRATLTQVAHPFDRAVVEADLELISSRYWRG